MNKNIEDRLQWVEDMLNIQQKLFTYGVAMDTKNWALLDEIFTPDCTFDYGEAGMGAPMTTPQFAAACAKTLGPLISQHTMSSPTIKIDGDTATSHTYGANQHVDMTRVPNHQMLMAGFYDDQWRRTERGWRIIRRSTLGSWAAGNPAVIGQKSIRGSEAVE